MSCLKNPLQVFGTIVVVFFIAGCGAPAAAPTLTPTITLIPSPQTPLPPPTPKPTPESTGQPTLFKFIGTAPVTPDDNFLTGSFARVNYVPATEYMVVTFGTWLGQPSEGCIGKAHAYREYTLDMEATGKSGILNCEVADIGSVMVDNTYYFVGMHAESGSIGWRIIKYDAATWKSLADIFFPLQTPQEGDGDPMVAFVNGQLDVSSGYTEAGGPPAPGEGAGTHHQFFSPDLEFQEERILEDTPHIGGSSMIYVDGVYYFITSTSYTGDVIVMKYDKDWNYIGKQDLIRRAHFSTGVAYDGNRFYLAYTDTSQRTEPGFFPVYLNIHLAVFDRDWNLVEDLAVTNFTPAENRSPGRPGVILHGNRLYVSYDLDSTVTLHDEIQSQAIVSVYELTQ